MNRPPQLHGLTAARGIAAWLVVLYHMRGGLPWLPETAMAVAHKGYLAVDFFFVLSGFVIWLTAHTEFRERGFAATADFLKRRAARIYPLYAAMLAATVLFAAVLTMTGRDSSGYPWRELPLHVLMLQNWGFTDALSWNHPAWSISTEFAACLLFPLLAVFVPLARAPRWILVVGIAAVIALLALTLGAMGHRGLNADIPANGLIRCLAEFTAGTMLCALWQANRGQSAPFQAGRLAALVAFGAALAWAGAAVRELWAFPAIAAAVIYLLALASERLVPVREPAAIIRPFVWLGEISYATYLSHFMLFSWFKIILVDDP
ncbi:MAG: acyltransferase family protein, partial [Sphingobium sp.]